MQQYIMHFVSILRGSGIRVSTSEILDSVLGMEHIELADKGQFKNLLRATLIKNPEDLEAFERLFELTFASFDLPHEGLSPPLSESSLESSVQDILEQANGLFSPTFRQIVLQGLPGLTAAITEAGQQIQLQNMDYPLLQSANFAARIRRQFGMEGWPEQTRKLISRLQGEGGAAEETALLEARITAQSELFRDTIQDYVNRYGQALPKGSKKQADPYPGLLEKRFDALNEGEIGAMREVILDLVKKIRDEYTLRQRLMRRGRFDLKQTLRKSMRYGGVPMEISLRKRKKSKGRIVALCDVSRSVWNASRFMLHLLYSFQDQFDKVRSFVFVDELGEVTECFEDKDVNRAIEAALRHASIPYNRYTDYGAVFQQFCEEKIDAVNRKTSFIVIGDGRNNFFHPGEEYLARIQSRARRVVWLNPESKGFWNLGDSKMHRYRPCCDEVLECRNLKQLTDFINQLVL